MTATDAAQTAGEQRVHRRQSALHAPRPKRLLVDHHPGTVQVRDVEIVFLVKRCPIAREAKAAKPSDFKAIGLDDRKQIETGNVILLD